MYFKKYLKKRKRLVIILSVIISILAASILIINVKPTPIQGRGANQTDILNSENPGEKVDVIVVSKRIEKGEIIKLEKILLVKRFKNYLPVNPITTYENAVGKVAEVTLEKNVIPTADMLSNKEKKVQSDERISNYELQGGLVLDLVKEGDYVDIEYVKEDGETFVVLAKKKVYRKVNEKIVIQTTLKERKMINYVIAEKESKGGKIEAAIYIGASQQASKVTYSMPKTLYTKSTGATTHEKIKNNFELQGGLR
ncbi:MAG: hypothetical protein WC677_02415 [Clostridia bacterium]